MLNNTGIRLVSAAAAAVLFSACGGGSSGDSTTAEKSSATEYVATSSLGDLVSYTIDGSKADIKWLATTTTGAVRYTWDMTTTCGVQNNTFGFRECTIVTAVCTDGEEVCSDVSPSGEFVMMELPGLALLAHVPASLAEGVNGSTEPELHSGFTAGGCPTDVSGEYAYVVTGGNGSALFGVYHTDSTFNSVTHADFGMETNDASLSTAVASYATGTPVENLAGDLCQNSVFTRTIGDGEGNDVTLRMNVTSAGAFILDKPAGMGGMVAFKTSKAATMDDIANRNWWGMAFSDTAVGPNPIAIQTKAVNAGVVPVFGQVGFNEIDVTIKSATAPSLFPVTKFDAPAAYTASENPMLASIAAPKDIPGLVQFDDNDGGNIVGIASKFGNEVIMFGIVYNHLTAAGEECMAGSGGDCKLRPKGNFVTFTH